MTIDYQCCFCALGIDRDDETAIMLTLRNLWEGDQSQDMFAHSACANQRFAASLSASVPFDLEALRD
jgi:hypothetical protein